jgi:hypothetical protein
VEPWEYDERGCITNASPLAESMLLDVWISESNTPDDYPHEFFVIDLILLEVESVISDRRKRDPMVAGEGDQCEWISGWLTNDEHVVNGGDIEVNLGDYQWTLTQVEPQDYWYYGKGGFYYPVLYEGSPDIIDPFYDLPLHIVVPGNENVEPFEIEGFRTPSQRMNFTEPVHSTYTTPDALVYRWDPGASPTGRLRVLLTVDGFSRQVECLIADDGEWTLPDAVVQEIDEPVGVTSVFTSQWPCHVDLGHERTGMVGIRHQNGRTVYVVP